MAVSDGEIKLEIQTINPPTTKRLNVSIYTFKLSIIIILFVSLKKLHFPVKAYVCFFLCISFRKVENIRQM